MIEPIVLRKKGVDRRMKVKLRTEIDCPGLPIVAEVEAEVPDGTHELDVALYDAMSVTCRLLAKAARDDQKRNAEAVAAQ